MTPEHFSSLRKPETKPGDRIGRIMAVDDELHVRLIVKHILESNGFQIALAADTAEARNLLREQTFDLVLCDIKMPGESGMDLLRHIGREYPDTAVVMVSVIDDPSMARSALDYGAYGYVTKPFDSNELLIQVNNALRRRLLEVENARHREKLESLVAERTAALMESEEQYRTLVDTMTEGVAKVDHQGRLTYVNQRFCDMLGYEKGQLLGKVLSDLLDVPAKEIWHREMEKRRTGSNIRYELALLTRDGDAVHTIVSPTPYFNDQGAFTGSVGVVTDITQRKIMEMTLQQEVEINTALAQTAAELVSQAGLEDISQLVLHQALHLTGSRLGSVSYLDPETGTLVTPALTPGLADHFPAENRPVGDQPVGGPQDWVLANLRTLLSNHPSADDRFAMSASADSPLNRCLAAPALVGGHLFGMVMVAETDHDYTRRDQTVVETLAALYAVAVQRRRQEDETRKDEQRWRLILDSVAAGIIIVDEDTHTIVEANPLAIKTIGVPREELVGRKCWDYFRTGMKNVCPVAHKKKKAHKAECVLINSAGEEVPILKTVVPIEMNGRPHLLETFLDITDFKAMEDRLARAEKLEAIGQLAAGIAHEINTPTQYIHGNLEFLREAFQQLSAALESAGDQAQNQLMEQLPWEEAPAPRPDVARENLEYLNREIPEALDGCLDGVSRIARIVDSMRYFAHPGGQEKAPIDINQAVEKAVTVSRNEWKYLADLEVNLDSDLPLFPGYLSEFSQVLLNLIVNAAQAIGEQGVKTPGSKGLITIGTTHDEGWIELRIRDSGGGIPEAVQARIFDPFFTTKVVGKGTGQGLAIAHSVIVEKHGGSIDFETELGQGTTFIVRLPVEPVIAQPAAPTTE
jgi:PAS domain S-box-containing protein